MIKNFDLKNLNMKKLLLLALFLTIYNLHSQELTEMDKEVIKVSIKNIFYAPDIKDITINPYFRNNELNIDVEYHVNVTKKAYEDYGYTTDMFDNSARDFIYYILDQLCKRQIYNDIIKQSYLYINFLYRFTDAGRVINKYYLKTSNLIPIHNDMNKIDVNNIVWRISQ